MWFVKKAKDFALKLDEHEDRVRRLKADVMKSKQGVRAELETLSTELAHHDDLLQRMAAVALPNDFNTRT